MNWLQKISQIPASQLPTQLWFHGTDSMTAYGLMQDMMIRPREETGSSSYFEEMESIPHAVYLTSSVGKAAKHALESSELRNAHPVILVIQPESLGYAHVDEDLVHAMIQGMPYFHNDDWYPSPTLEREIFDIASEELNLQDFEHGKSNKQLVLEYFSDMDDDRVYEAMDIAKYISASLNDKHQQESISNYGNMAHQGKVPASEIYLIPEYIDEGLLATSLKSYEELQQFGTRVSPDQLLMPFMYREPSMALSRSWLKTSAQNW